jgi:hypothetical protein
LQRLGAARQNETQTFGLLSLKAVMMPVMMTVMTKVALAAPLSLTVMPIGHRTQ